MTEHPDFINVRKLAITLALGPCALLLLLFTLDVSMAGVGRLLASQSNCQSNVIEASTAIQPKCP